MPNTRAALAHHPLEPRDDRFGPRLPSWAFARDKQVSDKASGGGLDACSLAALRKAHRRPHKPMHDLSGDPTHDSPQPLTDQTQERRSSSGLKIARQVEAHPKVRRVF
jgi:hypothetical protein